MAVPDAGGRPPGRRWVWRSVGLLLTFLLVLYLGGPLLAGAQGAGKLLSRLEPGWLVVAVALEAAAIASYTGLTCAVLPGARPRYGTLLRIDLSAFGLSHSCRRGRPPVRRWGSA